MSAGIKLEESIYYLHVEELKELCTKLSLSLKGKKGELVHRIIHFAKTGEKVISIKFPEASCAKRDIVYKISKDSLILKGAYKNDLKTRLFFKEIIGQHFHFTAFGQDWTMGRWLEGSPPTYLEFANMWQQEYEYRKKHKVSPKTEWAYLSFIQRYINKFPNAARKGISESWHKERQKHKDTVFVYFQAN